MKALIKVMVCLCLATVMAGFAYAHLTAEPDYVVVEKPFVETFHSGDTVNGILKHYHNQELDGDFEEWKFNVLHLPENKHLLNQHGGLKLIQVGEKIHITCKVRVAK